MKILVIGGTRFFGVHLVETLLRSGHEVTLATRGNKKDSFAEKVKRIKVDRTDGEAMQKAFAGREYDVVCDDIAYCSNDIKNAMEAIKCTRYVFVSTISVYELHEDMREEEVNPFQKEVVWCNREDNTYDEIKRQAEKALFTTYSGQEAAAVRFPFVIGTDDYTERLLFYVKSIMKEEPIHIDNWESEITFIDSREAGDFLAFMAENRITGTINAASRGTVQIKQIVQYIETKTGKKAVLTELGEAAPYNGAPSFSVNLAKAEEAGYSFTKLQDWLYSLLDSLVLQVTNEK